MLNTVKQLLRYILAAVLFFGSTASLYLAYIFTQSGIFGYKVLIPIFAGSLLILTSAIISLPKMRHRLEKKLSLNKWGYYAVLGALLALDLTLEVAGINIGGIKYTQYMSSIS